MSLSITSSGSFNNADNFLSHMSRGDIFRALESYAQRGVAALASATPQASGVTASSWEYEIVRHGGDYTIWWTNRHVDATGTPIVIMLQLGHGTGTGGYVQGRNFINPAIAPIFDQIANDVWKEVTSS
jgi:hypothetical protein